MVDNNIVTCCDTLFIMHVTRVNRLALTETKKQVHDLSERVQALQNELANSEVRRSELEGQIRQAHTVGEGRLLGWVTDCQL